VQTSVPELHPKDGRVKSALVVVKRVGTRVLEIKPVFHLRARGMHACIHGATNAKAASFTINGRRAYRSRQVGTYDSSPTAHAQLVAFPIHGRIAINTVAHDC